MDWTNERYVRIYVRDTADLLAVGWEGRAVLWEMIRKADRAGVVDGDEATLPELVRMPREVVAAGLPRLLERRVVERGQIETSPVFVLPNFIEAQEAAQSDRQRQAESRARRRDLARRKVTECDTAVTDCDELVTNRDENVTAGHTVSQPVTACHSVPSLAVPSLAKDLSSTSGKSQPSTARRVFDFWAQDTGHTRAKLDAKRRRRIDARLREGFSADELMIAIRHRRNDPWLMGKGESPRVYDGIEVLLRDAAQVERLRDLTTPLPVKGGNSGRPAYGPEAVRQREEREAAEYKGVSDEEWMRDDD